MDALFDSSITQIIQDEGVLSNKKFDPGGITKYGISLRFLKENNIDLNHDGSINGKDIYYLTIKEAEALYKTYFWEKSKIYLIQNQSLADKVFDLSVNMGSVEAIKLLQKTINLHIKSKIIVDGKLGEKTLYNITIIPSAILMKDYKNIASNYYQNLVIRNPDLHIFLKGWLKRAQE